MKGRFLARSSALLVVALLAVGTVGLTATAAASAAVSPPTPGDLEVTASLDKEAYDSGDVIKVRVTISNKGTATATHLYGRTTSGSSLNTVWRELGELGSGVHLEPGASKTVELEGTAADPDSGSVVFNGKVIGMYHDSGAWIENDANPADNGFAVQAPVTKSTGTVTGVVYRDRNANNRPDAGEGMAGVKVTLSGGVPWQDHVATTDGGGKLALPNLPSGTYYASYEAPDGWLVQTPRSDADELHLTKDGLVLERKAVRPLSEQLTAAIAFTKPSYAVGEPATASVTLTNRGKTALTGITSDCNRIGDSHGLNGRTDGWGDLRSDGPGVSVPAGQTRSFTVSEPVPSAPAGFGFVKVSCQFGNPTEHPLLGQPSAKDGAPLTGVTTDARGQLYQDRNNDGRIGDDEGVAGVVIALRDAQTGAVQVQTVTDAKGGFVFAKTPPNLYKLYLADQWKFTDEGRSQDVEVRLTEIYPAYTFEIEPRCT